VKLKTRVFELTDGKYSSLSELAKAMGIPLSQLYPVREGKRNINEKFIIAAATAFPEHKLGDLFYLVPDGSENEGASSEAGMITHSRRDEIVELRNAGLTYAEIGSRFGISKERARQILKRKPAQKKLSANIDAMLTISDVARLLNIHVNTVRRLSNQGTLKSYRIGSRADRRFRREDVDALLVKTTTKAEEVSSERLTPTFAAVPSGMRRKRLTDRQLEILKLVAEGLDSKEIAERLSITEHTIKNQIYVACRCIGAENRAHAVAILYGQGWLGKEGTDAGA